MKKLASLLFFLSTAPAMAHGGHGEGFIAGFFHPVGGADHVLAMLAVGLWATFRGGKALFCWPITFMAAMMAGFALAPFLGAIPGLEAMITSSVILLGTALALGFRGSIIAGAALIGLAGAAHGYAHGLEMEGNALGFGSGFTVATAALHGTGILIGIGLTRLASSHSLQATGGLVATAGLVLAMA